MPLKLDQMQSLAMPSGIPSFFKASTPLVSMVLNAYNENDAVSSNIPQIDFISGFLRLFSYELSVRRCSPQTVEFRRLRELDLHHPPLLVGIFVYKFGRLLQFFVYVDN